MHGQDIFIQVLVYLMAAVISVPLAKKLGFGSVLGYLLAGILIGPFVMGLVGNEGTDIMHFAEFGVVLMLFLIGLELEPAKLWKMRRSIFGLGGMQVLFTAILLGTVAVLFKFKINQAIGLGLILALSSTAIVLQTLSEKGLLKNQAGKSAFSVLLFQDISVIPILAIIPILAAWNPLSTDHATVHPGGEHIANVSSIPGWLQLLLIIALVSGIIIAGKFISRYIFRYIAETGLREVFTATALLLVVGISLAMVEVGLSPALGSFLAGVVLADSEYRHELETTIDPFKGILLGLFFISVGSSIDFNLLIENPLEIIFYVFLLIVIKFIVLVVLGKVFKLRRGIEMLFAFSLAQASEFGFVLISFSEQSGLFAKYESGLLMIVVAMSMVISPLLLIFNDKLVQPIFFKKNNHLDDDVSDDENPVIIAGFGRFGLTIGRLLIANDYKVTILDSNPTNIEFLRKYGFKVYYGDVSRPAMLEAAGIKNAKVLILSMAEYDVALQLAGHVSKNYPDVKILARARDIFHVFDFLKLEIDSVQQETFNSALELGLKVLVKLGFKNHQAYRAVKIFKKHDQEITFDLYKHWQEGENHFIQETRRFSEELRDTLQSEKEHPIHEEDDAWDIETLKEEVKQIVSNKNN